MNRAKGEEAIGAEDIFPELQHDLSEEEKLERFKALLGGLARDPGDEVIVERE